MAQNPALAKQSPVENKGQFEIGRRRDAFGEPLIYVDRILFGTVREVKELIKEYELHAADLAATGQSPGKPAGRGEVATNAIGTGAVGE